MDIYQNASEAVIHLKNLMSSSSLNPGVGIICGSGLGGLVNIIDSTSKIEVDYADIPHFAKSTVQGHAGKLVIGRLGSSKCHVVIMVGRLHYFEGHSIQEITFPIRVLFLLGISKLIVTNAAGGLNPKFAVGDIVVIRDHLNLPGLSGCHPLRGPNTELFGPRFPPLSDAYDLGLRKTAHRAWRQLNSKDRTLHEGIYAFVSGPSYETRAECRFLQGIGADVVGMSTVPEVIVARHSGIKILAISLVTNVTIVDPGPSGYDPSIQNLDQEDLCSAYEVGKANHEEVLEAGQKAAKFMEQWVCQIVDHIDQD